MGGSRGDAAKKKGCREKKRGKRDQGGGKVFVQIISVGGVTGVWVVQHRRKYQKTVSGEKQRWGVHCQNQKKVEEGKTKTKKVRLHMRRGTGGQSCEKKEKRGGVCSQQVKVGGSKDQTRYGEGHKFWTLRWGQKSGGGKKQNQGVEMIPSVKTVRPGFASGRKRKKVLECGHTILTKEKLFEKGKLFQEM